MTQSVNIYMSGVLIGAATATAGSATLASFSEASNKGDGRFNPGALAANNKGYNNETVEVHSISGSNATGKAYQTRVIADGATSLTISDPHPFSD